MNRPLIFIWLTCLILVSGCGRKTAPEPNSGIAASLVKIKNVNAYFKHQQLIVQWEMPELLQREKKKATVPSSAPVEKMSDLAEQQRDDHTQAKGTVRIRFFSEDIPCLACEKKEPLFIELDTSGIVTAKSESLRGDWKIIYQEIEGKPTVSFGIAFCDRLGPRPLIILDYYLDGVGRSPESMAIKIVRPAPLPVPLIRYRREYVDKKKQLRSGKKLRMLYLNWTPVVENELHTLRDNGSVVLQKQFYGVVFYYRNVEGRLKKIDQTPQYEGRFLLLNFNLPLYAAHVDRFGNESKTVAVYFPVKD